MLPLDPAVIGWLAVVANILIQLVKGFIPEPGHRWIPLGLFVLMMPLGLLLALYTGRDLVVGLLEGFFGAASAVGLYELASSVPGVDRVFNGRGWL